MTPLTALAVVALALLALSVVVVIGVALCRSLAGQWRAIDAYIGGLGAVDEGQAFGGDDGEDGNE